jgi:hypothetical protein
MFVFGGFSGRSWLTDVHALDLARGHWSRVTTTGPPHGGSFHSATVVGGEIFLFGGVPRAGKVANKLTVFDPQTSSFFVPPTVGEPPRARSGHAACLVSGGTRLLITHGWDEPTLFADSHVLDIPSMQWSRIETRGAEPAAMCWFGAAAVTASKVVVAGGFTGRGVSGSIAMLDTESGVWENLGDAPVSARCGFTMLSTGERLSMFGGGNTAQHFFNDGCSVVIEVIPAAAATEVSSKTDGGSPSGSKKTGGGAQPGSKRTGAHVPGLPLPRHGVIGGGNGAGSSTVRALSPEELAESLAAESAEDDTLPPPLLHQGLSLSQDF